jgi:hypothetical protein
MNDKASSDLLEFPLIRSKSRRRLQMKAQGDKAARTAPLATPTDLKPNAVGDLAGALNVLLADMFGLYLKTKNFP